MTGPERGFLLLTSLLGDPERRPLTLAQFRALTNRAAHMEQPDSLRDLEERDLVTLGCDPELARRILALLDEEDRLDYYLAKGKRAGCVPVTRVSAQYPWELRSRLGAEAPGCLWAKGDLSLLDKPAVALVGSRDLNPANREFAREVGRQAAIQGFTLVSGNARGADREAQNACLEAGGRVISIVADELAKQPVRERMLYLSEDDFDQPFSKIRALSRNRSVHAWSGKTFVAQATLQKGGTWDGTSRNLRFGWSSVYCFADGSDATTVLGQMGASPVTVKDLDDFEALPEPLNFLNNHYELGGDPYEQSR